MISDKKLFDLIIWILMMDSHIRRNKSKLERAIRRVHTFANATFVTMSEDRELKSEHFGVSFIWMGRKLSALWQKYAFDLFVTLTFDFWPDRSQKSNRLALGWWQITPENFMQFGPVVFDPFVNLTLTFDLIAPKI